jgi:hypothetical protein
MPKVKVFGVGFPQVAPRRRAAVVVASRRTVIVHGRFSRREHRLAAARDRRHGLQIMSFEQMAVRLAGGFIRPIDNENLRAAIQTVLPVTPLGELETIKALPGMVNAAADTLNKVWRAGIDLAARASENPRLDAIAQLEKAVLAHLPAGMLRPVDVVAAAAERLAHAPSVLGSVTFHGLTELSPCWRPLLKMLAQHIEVTWTAGPRSVPSWLDGMNVAVVRSASSKPSISAISAATAYHEAIEAMRWARSLLASGTASPADIAIAAASPEEYDDHFQALKSDANLDLHFVHGVRVITTREGQAAAALADILVRGISQSRLRRLAALCKESEPFASLPEGWMRVLPADAPLSTPQAWDLLLARLTPDKWPDDQDHVPHLRPLVDLLLKGTGAAKEIGEAFLERRALAIWRKALVTGPAASIDATLETLREDDGLEACVSVAWMSASELAASPRRFVRLLGLNSTRWPRNIAEDRLIPHHIIPTSVLDPLPVNLADRRDFETILATTSDEVVLSRSRRDSDGRLLGRSPLLAEHRPEIYLRRNATPIHAFSETDRLMARPREFAGDAQAISARTCWRDWRRPELTPHDGLIRAEHPLILAILARTQSASSLRRLLRNPLGFVWFYGCGWRMPESSEEPLVLEPPVFGDLVHMVLEHALQDIEANGGLASADEDMVRAAVGRAVDQVAALWGSERALPPPIIWRHTLSEVGELASKALTFDDDLLPGARSYGEVPFGGAEPKPDVACPWDAGAPVTIPGTGFTIKGYIDRLDIAADGKQALVRDYKTGKPPKEDALLDGGRELQRCLYACAVKALLGEDVAITASLLFPHEQRELSLDDADALLAEISGYLRAAHTSLADGAALIGPDAAGTYDDLAFALPANASATYCKRKLPAAVERFGELAQLWGADQ